MAVVERVQTDQRYLWCAACGRDCGCRMRYRVAPMAPVYYHSPDIFSTVITARRPHHAYTHCIAIIDAVLKGAPKRFKIGLTGNPSERWYGSVKYFRYWDKLDLLHASQSLEAAYMLEAALIDKYFEKTGCANRGNLDYGGGGRPRMDEELYYVYIVSHRVRTKAEMEIVESRKDLRPLAPE